MMKPDFYGIVNTNRANHWTKNRFNTSFPTALANYMMDKDMPAVYAHLASDGKDLKVVCDEISIKKLYNCDGLNLSDLKFDFESKYDPYGKYVKDNHFDGIDLVVKDCNDNCLAPVEIKQTVMPTSNTAKSSEDKWGCELVIRSATTSYVTLSIWDSVKSYNNDIKNIFFKVCNSMHEYDWTSENEVLTKSSELKNCLNTFEIKYCEYQSPLVLQAIWKTDGQKQELRDDAFDVVVWSNLAISRLFIDADEFTKSKGVIKMSRPMRATARMARSLWDLSKSGTIDIDEIYKNMSYSRQTDREFAISGNKWRDYIGTGRVTHPVVSKNALNDIVQPKSFDNLKPERRLDQTLYFTSRYINKKP